MEKTTTCGGDLLPLLLPEDALIEILVCLPVQSLLRFKFVCKSWRELIESSFFIDLHTTITFNSSSSSSSKFGYSFIIQTTEPSYKYEDIKLFKLSSGDGDGDGGGTGEGDDNKDDDDDQKKKKMVFKVVDDLGFLPFYKDIRLSETLRMVGSCNGIICLHDPAIMDVSKGRRQNYSNLRDVCLWNPATRQFRILPKSIPIQEKQYYMGWWFEDFIAFGFDVKTKDYKVLRITPWEKSKEGRGCMCRVQVYSLSTDSWRLLEGINSLPVLPNQAESLNSSGIYLNGSYFFAVTNFNISGAVMLSFDFTQEIFTTMPIPNCNSIVSSYLGEKLVVIFETPRYDRDSGYDSYDICRVFNEQHCGGVNKESWTKLHSFQIKKSRAIFLNKVRCISNNGEFALMSSGFNDGRTSKLQLFNLVTKEAIKDFTGFDGKSRVDVYKESLVSIMGGGNVLLS